MLYEQEGSIMQKITKIWITAGALLTALGLIMFAAAMTAYG